MAEKKCDKLSKKVSKAAETLSNPNSTKEEKSKASEILNKHKKDKH